MKKPTFKKELPALVIILIAIILSCWAYPQLPSQVASHWDFNGQVNGWSSKELHSLLFPGILIFTYLTFLLLPYLDPKKERYTEFAKTYRLMRDATLFLLLGVFSIATFHNLNYNFYNLSVSTLVFALIGALMIFLGNNFGKIKRNWFIGLRNPWSLSSENVWNKTHRIGGRLFMIWGLSLMIVPWINFKTGMIITIGGVILFSIGINLYSFLLYRQERKDN